MMRRFVTYDGTNVTEAGSPDIRSKKGWLLFYWQEIDKEVYPTFEGWLDDMLKLEFCLIYQIKCLFTGKIKTQEKFL